MLEVPIPEGEPDNTESLFSQLANATVRPINIQQWKRSWMRLNNIDITRVRTSTSKFPSKLEAGLAEAFCADDHGHAGRSHFIVGPTRAGKTELLRRVGDAVCGVGHGQGDEQPIVSIELSTTTLMHALPRSILYLAGIGDRCGTFIHRALPMAGRCYRRVPH